MTETVVVLQPAFILQHRHYRETSLILDLLTRDHGIVGVLAKGVRKTKSKTAGILQPFKALSISYYGKADLKTLTQVELQPGLTDLTGLALYCGFYVNELISRFLHKHDPHPEVYADYLACLTQMAQIVATDHSPHLSLTPLLQLEAVLRIFELNLMQHIGLALLTQHDAHTEAAIKPAARYHFQAELGVIEHYEGTVSGKTIQAINDKLFTDAQTLCEVKKIMRSVINFHLQGRPLKSRDILSKIYQQL
ncbi:MAG: DNA repair protein RecO [Methylococcaceae bacterium]|nr:DNA repair protein RecO [Methylococcaceae bacterium]